MVCWTLSRNADNVNKDRSTKKKGGGAVAGCSRNEMFVLDVTTLWDSKLHYHNTFIEQPLKNF
jgi:hypothetical protein